MILNVYKTYNYYNKNINYNVSSINLLLNYDLIRLF